MAVTEVMDRTIVKGERHELGHARLRPMGPRHRQLRCLQPVRLQLLQAAHRPRLALVRRVQRIPGRAVRGDVRLSAEHLFPLGLAAVAVSRRRLVLARRRTSARDDIRLEEETALWAVSYFEFRADRRRFRVDRRGLARALRCPATPYPRNHWAIQPHPSPAIRGLHPGDARLPRAVADAADAGDVSRAGVDVRAAGAPGGARRASGVRRDLRSLCGDDAGVVSAARWRRHRALVASVEAGRPAATDRSATLIVWLDREWRTRCSPPNRLLRPTLPAK